VLIDSKLNVIAGPRPHTGMQVSRLDRGACHPYRSSDAVASQGFHDRRQQTDRKRRLGRPLPR
jgi:hypothetical protein